MDKHIEVLKTYLESAKVRRDDVARRDSVFYDDRGRAQYWQDRIDALEAAIAALEQEWQPIKSRP